MSELIPYEVLKQLIKRCPCVRGASKEIIDFIKKEKATTKRERYLKERYLYSGMHLNGLEKGKLIGYQGWEKGVEVIWAIDKNGNVKKEIITYKELSKQIDLFINGSKKIDNITEQLSLF